MKLEETYIRFRKHFPNIQDDQPVKVNLEELAALLFYTTRNIRIIIRKLDSLNWISWQPGRGRGKESLITFHKSIEEVQLELFKSLIFEGNVSEAFIRVETEAPSIKMELTEWYYQTMFICYYKESSNRVYARIRELITKDNVHIYFKTVADNIEKTKPGYTILIDMAKEENVNTPDVENEMIKLRRLVQEKGLRAMAIVTKSDYLIPYVNERFDDIAPQRFFSSREDAEDYLDSISTD